MLLEVEEMQQIVDLLSESYMSPEDVCEEVGLEYVDTFFEALDHMFEVLGLNVSCLYGQNLYKVIDSYEV